MLNDFALKSVDVLARERQSLGDSFEQVAVHLFDLSSNYHLNESDKNKMSDLMQEKLGLNIEQVRSELSPLQMVPPS